LDRRFRGAQDFHPRPKLDCKRGNIKVRVIDNQNNIGNCASEMWDAAAVAFNIEAMATLTIYKTTKATRLGHDSAELQDKINRASFLNCIAKFLDKVFCENFSSAFHIPDPLQDSAGKMLGFSVVSARRAHTFY
jgi:hypothetical protein